MGPKFSQIEAFSQFIVVEYFPNLSSQHWLCDDNISLPLLLVIEILFQLYLLVCEIQT